MKFVSGCDDLLFGDQNQISGGAKWYIRVDGSNRAESALEPTLAEQRKHRIRDPSARRAAFVRDQNRRTLESACSRTASIG